jgi:hypothetical protein
MGRLRYFLPGASGVCWGRPRCYIEQEELTGIHCPSPFDGPGLCAERRRSSRSRSRSGRRSRTYTPGIPSSARSGDARPLVHELWRSRFRFAIGRREDRGRRGVGERRVLSFVYLPKYRHYWIEAGDVEEMEAMRTDGGAPGVTRTPGTRFRKPLLCPPELRGHSRSARRQSLILPSPPTSLPCAGCQQPQRGRVRCSVLARSRRVVQ